MKAAQVSPALIGEYLYVTTANGTTHTGQLRDFTVRVAREPRASVPQLRYRAHVVVLELDDKHVYCTPHDIVTKVLPGE